MFRQLCAAVPFLAVSCVSTFEKNPEPSDTDIVDDTDTDIVDDTIPEECLDAVPCVEQETIYVGNVDGLQELMQCSEVRNLELIGVEGLERLELPCLRKANVINLWNSPSPDLVSISLPQLRAGYDDDVLFALLAWDQPKLERIEAMPLLREAVLWFENNPLLHDIDGFSAVSKFGNVWLQNNPSLAQTMAFSSAEEIGPYLEVRETPVELDFLDALMPVMDKIALNDTSIESLDFLNDIESVGALRLHQNAGLSDFSGLLNIAFHEINNGDGTFTPGSLSIRDQAHFSELFMSPEGISVRLENLSNLRSILVSSSDLEEFSLINTGVKTLILPATFTIESDDYGNGLRVCDNAELENLVMSSLHSADNITLDNNPLLQLLELPRLSEIDSFFLRQSALQDISMPDLTVVNDEFRVEDNPQLCQEQVQAIADSVGVTCDCTNNQSCE